MRGNGKQNPCAPSSDTHLYRPNVGGLFGPKRASAVLDLRGDCQRRTAERRLSNTFERVHAATVSSAPKRGRPLPSEGKGRVFESRRARQQNQWFGEIQPASSTPIGKHGVSVCTDFADASNLPRTRFPPAVNVSAFVAWRRAHPAPARGRSWRPRCERRPMSAFLAIA
jgi:hypothetical protein